MRLTPFVRALLAIALTALVAVSLATMSPVWAAPPKPIDVGNDVDRRDIAGLGDVYDGRGDILQIETAVGADGATGRMAVRASTVGTNPNWFVFALRNPTDKPVERWLIAERYEHAGSGIIWPNLDARRMDNVTPSLGFVPERLPFDNADAFRLTIEPGQTVTFAAELVGDRVPRIQLWRGIDYEKRVRNKQLFHGILLGIVGLLALFLASIFVANHQAIFPSAALFAWMVLAYLCVDFGFWHKLFSVRPEESAIYRAAGEAGMSASLLVFSYTFLRIGRWNGFVRMLAGLAILSQLTLLALAFLDPRLAATFARVSLAGVLVISAIVTLYLVLRGQDRALAVLPTWILFGVWLFAAALVLTGRLQSDTIVNGVVAGLVLLVVLMGFTVTQFAFRSVEPVLGGSPDDQQLRALAVDATGAAVFEWGAKRDEVRVGPLVDGALGLPPNERREPLQRFIERVHSADRDKLVQSLSGLSGRANGRVRLDFRMLHADGSDRWFALDGAGVPVQDPRLARCVGLIREITDQRREQDRLLTNAVRDGTTFLPNRSLLLDRLDVGIARAKAEPLVRPTVFYIDVDRSQSVSAAHVGEAVIVSIARKFQRLVRAGDVVGRLGADQFALITMQVLDAREQRLIADDLRAAIKGGLNISGHDIVLSGSIGIASYDPQSPPARAGDLLSDAEIAMQRARRAGPDCIETFTTAMRSDKDQRAGMERELIAAMERRQIEVLFQPIIYLRTGTLAGFEAVARWEHPKLGVLDPADFAPLDDASMFATRLGGYVLRASVAEAQKWHAEHPRPEAPIFVSMNVARRQLFGDDLVKQARSLLASGSLPKGALRIDVTEALVLDNPEQSTALLRDLTQAGVRVSLDDFGAGYSSMSFLGSFAIDSVKIDGAFLHGAAEGRAGTAVLRSLVALAHELGKTVVAKGADDEADLGLLRTVGCDFAQGSTSGGRFVAPREAMALVRHLRKTERRLKRTGLFRLRNRRIEDETDESPATVAAPSTAAAAATATPKPAAPPTAQPQMADVPYPAGGEAAVTRPAQRPPQPRPDKQPLREAIRTTSRPRPAAQNPAPDAPPPAASPPSSMTQPLPVQPPAQRPMQPPSALTMASATNAAMMPQSPPQRPPQQLQAAERPPMRPIAEPPISPSVSPRPVPPQQPPPLPLSVSSPPPMPAPSPVLAHPPVQAEQAPRPLNDLAPPPLQPQPIQAQPVQAMRELPPASPQMRLSPAPETAPEAPPASMVDRTLARLQAEIARTISDTLEPVGTAAPVRAVGVPPPIPPPVQPPRPVPQTAPQPAPAADVSSLPPALAESLARLAGRAGGRKG